MDILAIPGSLRAGAASTALLAAAAQVAPRDVEVELYAGLGDLPHFNPDLDVPGVVRLPARVEELRERVAQADGLLISTPEYAHGLPGSLKNLLDWLVGSTDFAGKHVAVLRATERSIHAPAQLRDTLTVMSACIVDRACTLVPLERPVTEAAEVLAQDAAVFALRGALRELASAIARARGAHSMAAQR